MSPEDWVAHARARICGVCFRPSSFNPPRVVRGHHAVRKSTVQRANPDLAWDLRNCFPACDDCHAAHHHAMRRITAIELHAACPDIDEFAAEIGMPAILEIERYYP